MVAYQEQLDHTMAFCSVASATHPLSTSLGCAIQPEEVVELISFLVSGEAKLMCLMFAPVCNFSGRIILPLFAAYVIYTIVIRYYDYVHWARCGRDA
jgi:hypothetical protein